MLVLSASLQAQLTSTTPTLAWCWRITRADGGIVRLTSLDRDLTMDGTYQALGGYVPSAVDTELGWNSQNQTLEAILDSPAITETDLERGLYDYARIECFLVNYLNPPTTLTENPPNRIIVYRAVLGKLSKSNVRYSFEAKGYEYLLNNKTGAVTSKLCRARFGDAACGVNIASHSYSLSAATVASRRQFTLSPVNISVSPPGTQLQLTSAAMTWTAAEAEAVSLGGHLVTIRNATENQSILNQFGTQTLWIGLSRGIGGQFAWSSGEPITYTNWFNGDPNDYLGIEDYGAISWTGQTPGTWNDMPATALGLHYGVLEVPRSPINYTNAPDNWFTYGTVTFTSGLNAGSVREIASYTSNTVTLFENAPFPISPGDTMTVTSGCDKTLKNCFRYNNVVNFQGEPYIPTPDKFVATPIDAG